MAATTERAAAGPSLSKAEAARYLGLSGQTVMRLVAGRKLRCVKSAGRSGRCLFLRAELDRWLTDNNRLAR